MQQEYTVMVVDDDEDYCFVTKKILRKAGIEKIVTASNGLEALKKLRKISTSGDKLPGLIFLDLNMPIMNGFEFLEEERKSDELDLGQTRIFITTSSVLPKDKERANNYPIDGFISKPLTQQVLGEILS